MSPREGRIGIVPVGYVETEIPFLEIDTRVEIANKRLACRLSLEIIDRVIGRKADPSHLADTVREAATGLEVSVMAAVAIARDVDPAVVIAIRLDKVGRYPIGELGSEIPTPMVKGGRE